MPLKLVLADCLDLCLRLGRKINVSLYKSMKISISQNHKAPTVAGFAGFTSAALGRRSVFGSNRATGARPFFASVAAAAAGSMRESIMRKKLTRKDVRGQAQFVSVADANVKTAKTDTMLIKTHAFAMVVHADSWRATTSAYLQMTGMS